MSTTLDEFLSKTLPAQIAELTEEIGQSMEQVEADAWAEARLEAQLNEDDDERWRQVAANRAEAGLSPIAHPVPSVPSFRPSLTARPYVQTEAPLSQSLGDLITPAMAARFGVVK